ncbi:ferritin-like domain-containing protein [Sphingomonas xinjiangensis]|uniref:Iminophenyl-pyruvate dimer synthase domain-containing protein n=1 Tax=Sphingomonas xinjiangensis TaxID=643568 RepID=A0A840YSH4_9SPHN|nr:ferritin-like protein [Sphingomonas xinjiangensis]MBB5712641.1 hypothetical protein [Sphingomonas xinjiangensis]
MAEAAEVEHTLMCSYLYAAFSLRRRGEPGVSEEHGEALERWRAAIIDVAVEEMGHLVIVANLTVAVGGRPHFGRPAFPVSPGYFPSGVSVRLTGFSPETLDHFIFLERPQGVEDEDGASFAQEDYVREQATPGLMPSAQDYATIGHLYDAIRVNLEALEQEIGQDALFLGDPGSQVGPEVIDLEGVQPITSLADANLAIDVVVEQGEGSSVDRDDSHYHSFVSIRDEYSRLTQADPAFVAAWPVADSPVLRQPAEPEGRVFISHPDAARLLDFACATYGLLLRCLVQSFGREGREREAEQKALMSAAIDLMHALGDASTRLARLPAAAASADVHAGMSFTMLRGVEPLLGGAIERALLNERSSALVGANALIGDHAKAAIARAAATLSCF